MISLFKAVQCCAHLTNSWILSSRCRQSHSWTQPTYAGGEGIHGNKLLYTWRNCCLLHQEWAELHIWLPRLHQYSDMDQGESVLLFV